MKNIISNLIKQSVLKLVDPKDLPVVDVSIPQERYGDYSTNIGIRLAPLLGKPVFEIATAIAADLSQSPEFEKVEPMKNGFVNFKLNLKYLQDLVPNIISKDREYGKSSWGHGKKVLIEFVSANPTGPLHVGHGRWAVIGDDIASLLEAVGYSVEREFYINDIGNQVEKLEQSVVARMDGTDIPEGGYGGAYISDIAEKLNGDRKDLKKKVLDMMLEQQKQVLAKIGVKYDRFFSEETLHRSGKVKEAIKRMQMMGKTIEEAGALWFKSQEYGDDKNRVLIRENGETTYFAADIAYHIDKYERGYDVIIDVWGADHHGYVPRLKAAIHASGFDPSKFEVIIGQLVALFRGKEPVRMSKRTGDMVTLEEVVEEVGSDAARFFMTMTSVNSHLNFDLELAKQQASDNPVFYVQYAHARICNILAKSEIQNPKSEQGVNLILLTHEAERKLMRKLLDFEDEISTAARRREPHMLVEYAKELASVFHNFYHQCRVITEDEKLSKARLSLVNAARIVLRNVLELLKVTAPERM